LTAPSVPEPLSTDATASAWSAAVEAFGVVSVPVEEVAALRRAPGPPGGPRIHPALMKHADHQTVLALAALLKAVHDSGWQGRSFAEWGLIAAPRFLGRIVASAAIDKFKTQGVPGMSPLIIPTLSMHAVAGSLSLALGTHGFNYGVGGSHGHLAEALLAGLTARGDDGVPGVWVVATQFSPEPVPDTMGRSLNPSLGYAVALALSASAAPARSRLNLRAVPEAGGTGEDARDVEGIDPPSGLVALANFLAGPPAVPRPRCWSCPLPGGGAVELDDDPARAMAGLGNTA
jgi:hypothetical protein